MGLWCSRSRPWAADPEPTGHGKKTLKKLAAAAAAAKAAQRKAHFDNKGQGKGKGKRKGNELPANFAGCHYCKGPHFVKDCPKWIADGRPDYKAGTPDAKRPKTY